MKKYIIIYIHEDGRTTCGYKHYDTRVEAQRRARIRVMDQDTSTIGFVTTSIVIPNELRKLVNEKDI